MKDYKQIVDFIHRLYKTEDFIPLHAPVFKGNEKKYLNECIDSTFVSSVGKFVDQFEEMMAQFTGARRAIAVVNGTAALHVALKLVGVNPGDEVITQPLTFIATCNAICYSGASPVFVDVDVDTLGLSPKALKAFLESNYSNINGEIRNIKTGKRLSACVPMHTFGHPVKIRELAHLCREWNIPLVEDAAESLGSFVGEKHTGLFGKCGVLSFNGNKTITTGGGGMIITDDEELGVMAKHMTTTAKIPHKWEFQHDMVGYNYRMPNINAALGCAQFEELHEILEIKRRLANKYRAFFNRESINFVDELPGNRSNFWLNAVKFEELSERDDFLSFSNENNVMTRPIWNLMNRLPMYSGCFSGDLSISEKLEKQVVNIPSGVNG